MQLCMNACMYIHVQIPIWKIWWLTIVSSLNSKTKIYLVHLQDISSRSGFPEWQREQTTVDGCEILHQLVTIDNYLWNTVNIGIIMGYSKPSTNCAGFLPSTVWHGWDTQPRKFLHPWCLVVCEQNTNPSASFSQGSFFNLVTFCLRGCMGKDTKYRDGDPENITTHQDISKPPN